MFGFLKRRRAIAEAQTKIGVALHRQVKEAVYEDESKTTENLSTVFTPGYVYYFVRAGLLWCGCARPDGMIDKELRAICNAVMPSGKLYEIVERQLAALEIAKGMEEQKVIVGTNTTPEQLMKLFETGGEVGMWDGMSLDAQPDNFRRYLLGQEMHYRRLKSREEIDSFRHVIC